MNKKQNGRDLLQMQEPEIQSAESPEPEIQPSPEPATDHEAHNRALRSKLRHAVAIANGCARRLAREQDEAREKVRKLEWALLIERSAHQRRKDNPMCTPLLPTPAQVQARMAAEEEKKAQEEHRRQAQVERNLRKQLALKIECEREKERRDKEVQERKADSARSSARLERVWPRVYAAANALAISRGRQKPTFADVRDCRRLGPPRPVENPRTIPATSTSVMDG